MLSDAELLQSWSQGNTDAGEELFERHYKGVAAFFRTKARDHAAELSQKTFLACIESLPRFRGEGSFRSYLYGIAYRQLQRHYRNLSRDERIDFGLSTVENLDPTPSKIIAADDDEQQLLAALRRIPVEHQVVLELYYWQELTTAQCAEVLEIPHSTIKSRLQRARKLLEEQLEAGGQSPAQVEETLSGLIAWSERVRAQA